MKLNDKVYNVLKWVALICIPAIAVFYGQLGEIWDFPYTQQIKDTIIDIGLFIGVLIGVSTYNYNKTDLLDQYYQEEENSTAVETNEKGEE